MTHPNYVRYFAYKCFRLCSFVVYREETKSKAHPRYSTLYREGGPIKIIKLCSLTIVGKALFLSTIQLIEFLSMTDNDLTIKQELSVGLRIVQTNGFDTDFTRFVKRDMSKTTP